MNVTDAMVDRFLSWKLPEDFHPDAGISFNPEFNVEYNAKHGLPPARHQPIGTNLLTATQAKAMLEHVLADITHTSQAPPAMVRAALLVLLGHVEPGWDNCKWIVTEWLEGRLNAAPQAATGTVPPESSAPAVAAPHAHRCMSCGARWYCPHKPGNCNADENVLPSLVLPGPDGPTVFHHVCRKP